jgi:hypothetical protein
MSSFEIADAMMADAPGSTSISAAAQAYQLAMSQQQAPSPSPVPVSTSPSADPAPSIPEPNRDSLPTGFIPEVADVSYVLGISLFIYLWSCSLLLKRQHQVL